MPPRLLTYNKSKKRSVKEEKQIVVGKYTIRKFNLENICNQPRCIVLLGQRNRGKSTLVREILTHINNAKVPRYVVFAKTEPATGAYTEYGIPTSYIWTEWNKDALIAIYDAQIALQKLKQQKKLPDDMEDTRLVLVVDDFGYDKMVWQAPIWQEIFMNGRHHNIYVIVVLQYAMMIPPSLRSQIDVLFMLNERIKKNIRAINEHFISMLSLQELESMIATVTQDYRAIVYDNTKTNPDIDSILFFLKARPNLREQIGNQMYRDMDEVYRDMNKE
jgi:GTPase SAR1 family protein